jgi:SAM-dependent methyltransferase
VTGVDPSADLLERFALDAASIGLDVELIDGTIEELDRHLGDRRFDVVCCHGLLMYLDDRAGAIGALAARVAPGGVLSATVRNGHALALRPALRRDWKGALAAFDSRQYVNELGLLATADRIEDVEEYLARAGLEMVEWYGVRVLNDAIATDQAVPDGEELALLLDAEDQAGRRDPYRWMASQLHVIARHRIPRL